MCPLWHAITWFVAECVTKCASEHASVSSVGSLLSRAAMPYVFCNEKHKATQVTIAYGYRSFPVKKKKKSKKEKTSPEIFNDLVERDYIWCVHHSLTTIHMVILFCWWSVHPINLKLQRNYVILWQIIVNELGY